MNVIEASVPMIILFCVIRKDVDDLYEWQTFRPSSLHLYKLSTSSRITQKRIIVGTLASIT